MDSLQKLYQRRLGNTRLQFVRNEIDTFPWAERMVGIKGARGVGKTTLLLQHILRDITDKNEAIYTTLDNLYFYENRLFDMAEEFMMAGGKYMFLDEVHKYPNWSRELKMIYDELPELKVVFTGSSILQMMQGDADLSRRALIIDMLGLNFQEFLRFEGVLDHRTYTLQEIVDNHAEISAEICAEIKPLAYFKNYLDFGYYPFYKESKESYHQRVMQVINLIIDIDLVSIHDINIETVQKLKRLLYVIASSVPFQPNVTKLAEHLKASRSTVLMLIGYLRDAQLIQAVYAAGGGNNTLRKPEKIYLGNTNFISAIAAENHNQGNLRETFFLEALNRFHQVDAAQKGNFLVNEKYVFEVGGKNKTDYQIKDLPNGYIVADNIEIGYRNTIPLWLFGFMKKG